MRTLLATASYGVVLISFTGCGVMEASLESLGLPSLSKPSIALSTNTISTSEGSVESLTLTLSKVRTVPTIAKLKLESPRGDQNLDFSAVAATVTIPAGSTTVAIPITVVDDVIYEGLEDFTLTVTTDDEEVGVADSNIVNILVADNETIPKIVVGSSAENILESTSTGAVTVTMSPPSSQTVMVNYTVNPFGASSGIDFSLTGGMLTFAPGETSKTIPYTILQDSATEAAESFTVGLSTIAGTATLGSPSAQTVTIIDDDSPNLFISDVTVNEGGNAVFTVSLSTPSTQTITFDWATADGTGIAGNDYTAGGQSATMSPGITTKTITVPTTHTIGICESDKTFTVTLSNAVNAAIADASGVATIQDIDLPVLSVAAGTGNEGSTITHAVTLTPACPTKNVSFTWSTVDVDTSSADLTEVTAQAKTINAGQTTATLSVATTEDALDEIDEQYSVTLASPVNATLGTASATGTITDNDATPTISIANVSVAEGTGTGNTAMVFTVTPSAVSGKAITFNYATSDGTATTADGDYVAASTAGSIAAGAASGTFTVNVVKDAVHEADETVNVTLSGGAGYTVAGSTLTAQGTITDDDAAPTLAVSDVTVTEGTGGTTTTATVTVTASAASKLPIQFNYATSDGTALLSDSDYVSASGTLTIAAGQLTQTFTVAINQDAKDEYDETVNVTLSGGSGYTTAGSDLAGTITITDDDAAPTISIADVTVTEGTGGSTSMTFTVTPSSVSGKIITLTKSSTNGTAVAGADFTAPSGTLTIPADATSATFTVAIVTDSMDEDDETFNVVLSGGANYTAAGSDLTALATITDDDPPPTISIADASATEGSNVGFVITLSAASGKTITGTLDTSDDSASGGADYALVSAPFTFSPGTTSLTVNVAAVDDTEFCEPTETFIAELSALVNVTAGDTSAIGSIFENDFPKISISPSSVTLTEGGSQLFTVTADQTCSSAMKFTYQTVGVSADTGSDFPNQSAELTIAPGQTTATFTITTTDDSIKELAETFLVTAAPYAAGYTAAENGANIARIDLTDNDSAGAVYKVAASRGNTCAVSTLGEMRCWGENSDGQLGMKQSAFVGDEAGEMGDVLPPIDLGLGGSEKTLAATSGQQHTCVIVGAALPGDVKCFGIGGSRLGNGTTNTIGDQVSDMGTYVAGPPTSGLKKLNLGARTAIAITSGLAHTCIIDNNHKITCWGGNSYGELGRGNIASHGSNPADMGSALMDVNLSSTKTVALDLTAGDNFNCAILSSTTLATSGDVKCWGRNNSGQLGIGSTATKGISVATLGDYSDNGTPADLTDDIGIPFVNLGTGRTAKRVFAGSEHVCAILDNDRVKCWGLNTSAQLGLGHVTNLGDQPYELGDYNDNGTPLVFTDDVGLPYVDLGTDGSSNPLVVSKIATAAHSNCAMTNLGIKCWGRQYGYALLMNTSNYQGDIPAETGNGNPFRNFTWPGAETTVDIVGVGSNRYCALSSIGTVKCWGQSPELMGQENRTQITTIAELSAMPPIKLGTLESASALVPSNQEGYNTCVLVNSGSMKCWGWRVEGSLGDGMDYYGDESYEMGTHIANNYATGSMNFGGLTVRDAKLGPNFICALFTSGNGACWGNVSESADLQGLPNLYVGRVQAEWPPPLFKIPAARTILALSTTETNTVCALFDNFTSSCWGNNGNYRAGTSDSNTEIGDSASEVGENLAFHNLGTGRRALKISSGAMNVCALLDNLTVKCWGYNNEGSLGQELAHGAVMGRPSTSMGDLIPAIKLGTGVLARDVSAGYYNNCAVTTANKLKCWGDGSNGSMLTGDGNDRGYAAGQMGDALPNSDLGTGLYPIKLAPAIYGYCALLNDFSVKCWGGGQNGRLGSGSSSSLGGLLTSTGDGLPRVSLATGYTVRNIHSTYSTNCALLEKNSDHSTAIQCWGLNQAGSLGLGDVIDRGNTSGQMGDSLPFVNTGF